MPNNKSLALRGNRKGNPCRMVILKVIKPLITIIRILTKEKRNYKAFSPFVYCEKLLTMEKYGHS